MRLRRGNLRDGLVAVGCLVATAEPTGLVAGAVLLAAGSALHFWSKGCLEQNQKLVTAGPYRFTRNPFYLANGLIDLGLCCVIGRLWIAVPYAAIWWLAYRDTILREEERLATLFRGEFERYVVAVPRLIPSGRSLPRSEAAGRFTLGNPALARGSEYARIAGVWVAAATIVAWAWIRAQGLGIFAAEHAVGLGLVALVPVAWVGKLALAEVFRKPETVLLPFAAEPARRRLVTFGLVTALYLTARALDSSPRSPLGGIAFGLMFAAVIALPYASDPPWRRGLLQLGLALSIGVFAASRGVLWLASVPLLWVVLGALDDLAPRPLDERHQGKHEQVALRSLWPAFRPIAFGAVAGTLFVALGRILA